MEIKIFQKGDLGELERLVYSTIDDCYPGVYCGEAVAYFKEFHSREKIMRDAQDGVTVILSSDSRFIGTGTLLNSEIRRVFVLKEFQGRGIGKRIMGHLENIAAGKGVKKLTLCASLVSKLFYERLGYATIKKNHILLNAGDRLEYYDMCKAVGGYTDEFPDGGRKERSFSVSADDLPEET